MNSASPQRHQWAATDFNRALRVASSSLGNPCDLATMELLRTQAGALAQIACEIPESIGEPRDWIRVIRDFCSGLEESDPPASYAFAQALREALFKREHELMEAALSKARSGDAPGLCRVINALFLPDALAIALETRRALLGDASWKRWEERRQLIIGDAFDLLSEPAARATRELFAAPGQSGIWQEARNRTLNGTTGRSSAMPLFVSGHELDKIILSICASPQGLCLAQFDELLPRALAADPRFLSAGRCLASSDNRLPEPFISSLVARKALRAWAAPGNAWLSVSNPTGLAQWICSSELAIADLIQKIPPRAQWPHALHGAFRVSLPCATPLYFSIDPAAKTPFSASDCALLFGRPLALKALAKRFGPPCLTRINRVIELIAPTLAHAQALALRAQMARVEANEIEGAASPAPSLGSRAPRARI